jgi:transcriptional regulator with XRE-family HTH domain
MSVEQSPLGRGREFGDLLRSRRARLQPAEAGLPAGGRRRTPGLRREEVALLAGISPTYYTYLEQGRQVRPSHQVLEALARALRLDTPEREHLFELARDETGPERVTSREVLAPEVADLVDRLDPSPTYVTGRRWDVLTSNQAARALWTDWLAMAPEERNMLWWTFTDPAAKAIFLDWEEEARALLARFRSAAARHADEPEFTELIDRLHEASPEVRAWWPRHDVAPVRSGTKRLHHPQLGALEFTFVTLQVADDPEQKVVTFAATEEQRAAIAELISS